MTHYFEKTIVDAKDIYTEYLLGVVTPLLYEGFCSIYEKAKTLEETYIKTEQSNPDIKNPGVLVLFQHFLAGVGKLADNLIENEYNRIRDHSKCADIFDSLVKAVIKSHIIVLTYTASGKKCKIVIEKLHEKIEPKTFIHKCYVECATLFHDHPALFWHGFPNHEQKENQRIIYQLTKVGIKNAIRHCLPMKQILETYLSNDYVEEDDSEKKFMGVKDLLKRDLEGDDENDKGGVMKILDSTDDYNEKQLDDKEVNNIASLVFNRKVYDTLEGNTDESVKEKHPPIIQPIEITQKPIIAHTDEQNKKVVSEKENKKVVSEKDKKKESEKKQQAFDEDAFFLNQKKSSKVQKTNILADAVNAFRKEDIGDEKISIVKHSDGDAENFYNDLV